MTTLKNNGKGSQSSTGCVFDPGNDTGAETFAIYESGIGNYAVSLNEQLTPSQEAALNRQAAEQAAAQAQQQQEQAVAQEQAKVNNNVDQAAQTVTSDLSNLTSDTSNVNNDISGVNSALQQEQTDLTTTQQASAAVVAVGNNAASGGSSCNNATNVQGDATNVQGDATNVQGALTQIPYDLRSLQGALNTLESDQHTYLSAAKADSGYTSRYEPAISSITAAETGAQVAIKAGENINASGMTRANYFVSQANASAQAAEAAGC